ncbi:hypothetical protein K491DRAFT_672679 [Lophiostoma macrostomum CBS 122681]|uniref:Uncharacterized protein n=1 Tax=Lophiostoma macrostomum CBS 122681 TaxID=1314788 RepID=A0A6A6TVD0_9PLEO|nr:hypothetical protein K491DRAFT_672679 [Lophiostoma macrostomum CBS 122681]
MSNPSSSSPPNSNSNPNTHTNPSPSRLQQKISQMRLTIAPIVHVESGQPPPHFPSTMLELFLLTEDQLDAMAHYYSQTGTPSAQTYMYPQTMDWNRPMLCNPSNTTTIPNTSSSSSSTSNTIQRRDRETIEDDLRLTDYERLKVKMRMFARFIGMRGAETPLWEYERQVDILRRRIERSVAEEENRMERKGYRGPPRMS